MRRVTLDAEVAGNKKRTMGLSYLIFNTSLGWMGLMGSLDGLRRLVLPQPSSEQVQHILGESGSGYNTGILCEAGTSYFNGLAERLRRYLSGEPFTFPDRLDLSWATSFQRSVWETTQSIPYGETRSYIWVASKMGMSGAARAVGQALSRNRLPIIIPCHRVIRSDGSTGGFSDGKSWKRRLLSIESKAI